jgi:hypothetical protein
LARLRVVGAGSLNPIVNDLVQNITQIQCSVSPSFGCVYRKLRLAYSGDAARRGLPVT